MIYGVTTRIGDDQKVEKKLILTDGERKKENENQVDQ